MHFETYPDLEMIGRNPTTVTDVQLQAKLAVNAEGCILDCRAVRMAL